MEVTSGRHIMTNNIFVEICVDTMYIVRSTRSQCFEYDGTHNFIESTQVPNGMPFFLNRPIQVRTFHQIIPDTELTIWTTLQQFVLTEHKF